VTPVFQDDVARATDESPLPLREREGPSAERWEGEGAFSAGFILADNARYLLPPHPPAASRRAPPSPARGEGEKARGALAC
jgi:hypothetical protein